MIIPRCALPICYGLFSIGVQSLLFREFVTAFEGHDICIGIFFSAWFVWIAFGAWGMSRWSKGVASLSTWIHVLLIAYLPAFCLECGLMVYLRALAGIESYALMPIQSMIGWSLMVTAPVSLLTGVLFPVLCHWMEETDRAPIGLVYVWEAFGSLLGGILITLGLYWGMDSLRLFMLLACVLCLASLLSSYRRHRVQCAVISVCFLLCVTILACQWDKTVTRLLQQAKWQQRLPDQPLEGSFNTPQAEHLYGWYRDQWLVMRDGRVCESFGDPTQVGRLAALGLCQNPGATRIAVLGDGYALSERFLHLPSVTDVHWFHPDAQYVRALQAHLPPRFRIEDERFAVLTHDIRVELQDRSKFYDILIVNAMDLGNSAGRRYRSQEFYELAKRSLRYGGMVIVTTPGSEQELGEELRLIGACTNATLASVFAQVICVPGDPTTFVASHLAYLQQHPRRLRALFRTLDGAERVFPPDALLSVYRPERAVEVMALYDEVDLPEATLVQRDRHASGGLYQLLLIAKLSGRPLLTPVKQWARSGPIVLGIPLLVLVVVRLFYRLNTRSRAKNDAVGAAPGVPWENRLVVCAGGVTGIVWVIVLMTEFQIRFGSLFLYMGLLSALFMVGLTCGALLAHWWGGDLRAGYLWRATAVLLSVHLGLLFYVMLKVTASPGVVRLTIFLWAGGACCGGYVPFMARDACERGAGTALTAGHLERADHLGAAFGGLLASLFLIPVFGMDVAFQVLLGLVAACLVLALFQCLHPTVSNRPRLPHASLTPVGYVLFGLAVCVVLCANVLAYTAAQPEGSRLARLPAIWLEGREIVEKEGTLPGRAEKMTVYEVSDADQLVGTVVFSRDLSGTVYGYGGPMELATFVDTQGRLIDFVVTRHAETPGYLQWIRPWMAALKGQSVSGDAPLVGVDAVSGATLSSKAILTLLRRCGQSVTSSVSTAVESTPQTKNSFRLGDRRVIYLVTGLILAVAATIHGRSGTRWIVLAITVGIGGLLLNVQYSSEHVMRLLTGEVHAYGKLSLLALTLGVPLLVLCFGNLYCGYLCPFGALQECLGRVIPKRFKPEISASAMALGRFVKYGFLFMLVVTVFLTQNKSLLMMDPLVMFFNPRYWLQTIGQGGMDLRLTVALVLAVSLGILLLTRFWCRYLCPTGAFLSLLNHAAWLRRFLPTVKYGRCTYGLSGKDHLDCIYCDVCRHSSASVSPPVKERQAVVSRLFLGVVLCIAIGFCSPFVDAVGSRLSGTTDPIGASHTSGGIPRSADMDRIREKIDQGQLSDKEALFYRTVQDNDK